jgi:NAD(P)H dehydrogenase (quinone)
VRIPQLAVTGSTGRLGGRVARRLADASIPQRLVVRDLDRAPALAGVEIARADYRDGAEARAALGGITCVFMVSAEESADRVDRHRTFIDAAASVGVERIVYTSFYNAAPEATFTLARDHYATEQHIRDSGLEWTFLRDNLYLDFFRYFMGADGVIRGPAGDGRVAAVALNDIADAAVAVLSSPAEHAGRTYDLTGPEAISFAEAAETLATETGQPVRYHAETIEEAYASRAGYGAPDWQVEAWVTTYTAVAVGELDGVSNHVAQLTGHQPVSFVELLRRRSAEDS